MLVQEILNSLEVTPHEKQLRQSLDDEILAELKAIVYQKRTIDPTYCLSLERLRFDRELNRHLKRRKIQVGANVFEQHYGGPDIWSALTEKDLKSLLVRFVNYLNSENIQKNVLPRLIQLGLAN